jgi:hypothetical protein
MTLRQLPVLQPTRVAVLVVEQVTNLNKAMGAF